MERDQVSRGKMTLGEERSDTIRYHPHNHHYHTTSGKFSHKDLSRFVDSSVGDDNHKALSPSRCALSFSQIIASMIPARSSFGAVNHMPREKLNYNGGMKTKKNV